MTRALEAFLAFIVGAGAMYVGWWFDKLRYAGKARVLKAHLQVAHGEIEGLKKSDTFLTEELRKEIECRETADSVIDSTVAHHKETVRKYDEMFSRYSMAQAEVETLREKLSQCQVELSVSKLRAIKAEGKLEVLEQENRILSDKLTDAEFRALPDPPPPIKVRLVKKSDPSVKRVKL